jgi:hypothetical protein
VGEHGLSVVRACTIVRFSRAAYYPSSRPTLEADADVIEPCTTILLAWLIYQKEENTT